MLARFSSGVMPSAAPTCATLVLPTRQTVRVPALRTAASTSSLAAERPARLVIPKAVRRARVAGAASKNALSVGLAPGQPPSM